MGYFVAVVLQYIVSTYIFFIAAGITSLAIGSYLIALAATKEIRAGIESSNRKLQIENDNAYVQRVIFIFIQWHPKLKQLSFH